MYFDKKYARVGTASGYGFVDNLYQRRIK